MLEKISSIFNHSNRGIDESVHIQSISARNSNRNGVNIYLKMYLLFYLLLHRVCDSYILKAPRLNIENPFVKQLPKIRRGYPHRI